MIFKNFLSFLTLAALISTGATSYANSCKMLLSPSISKASRAANLAHDMKAIEVLASIALSIELQPEHSVFRPIKSALDTLKPNHPSIPRIAVEDIGSYTLESYDFKSISDAERKHILENLPAKMESLLAKPKIGIKSRKIGKNFHTRFSSDTVTGLLERISPKDLSDFLELNFEGIVLNAANMPRLSLGSKIKTFFKNDILFVGTASVILGGIAETMVPNFAFLMVLDPILNNGAVYQEVLPDLLHKSFDYSAATKYGASILSFHTAGSLFVTPFLGNKNGRFDELVYDFSFGKEARKLIVEETINREFPEED